MKREDTYIKPDYNFVPSSETESTSKNIEGNIEQIKETLTNKKNAKFVDKSLTIRRGYVQSINIYEITDNELDALEKGGSSGIYLTFSTILLTTAFNCITTLTTVKFNNDIIQICYIILAIIGIVGGVFLIILWRKGMTSVIPTIKKIKKRIPPETINYE